MVGVGQPDPARGRDLVLVDSNEWINVNDYGIVEIGQSGLIGDFNLIENPTDCFYLFRLKSPAFANHTIVAGPHRGIVGAAIERAKRPNGRDFKRLNGPAFFATLASAQRAVNEKSVDVFGARRMAHAVLPSVARDSGSRKMLFADRERS